MTTSVSMFVAPYSTVLYEFAPSDEGRRPFLLCYSSLSDLANRNDEMEQEPESNSN